MTSSDPTPEPADATSPAPETPPTPQPEAAAPASETPVVPEVGTAADAPPAPAPAQERKTVMLPALPPQPVPTVPPAPQPHDLSRIAQDLQIRKAQVEAVVQLLDEENTVPFITRYRKERTGGLNEEVIGRIQERVQNLRELASRKQTILKSIANQGRLNDALTQAILAAESPKRLEDLYLPFKPKKKSLATEAREKGLGPLAEAIWNRDPAVANLAEVLPGLVDPDKWLLNTDDVMAGVRNILADMVSDAADVRGPLRAFTWDTGLIAAVRIETLPEGKGKEYEPYFNFKELVKEIPPHRVLAINRGEKANVLRVRVDTDVTMANEIAQYHLGVADHPHRELLVEVVKDALERLVLPGLEREVRRELTERAQDHAVLVFAKNLKSLLLQPPLRGRKVLAVDPGIRTGCKLAVLDETGKLLEDAVVYPHGQKKGQADAKRKVEQLVRKHQISVIAIGNGTGCRETEQLVADLIGDLEHRRLNPPPAVPAATTETSATPAPAGPPPEAAAPVLPDVPPQAESIVSAPAGLPEGDNSISSVVVLTQPSVETVGGTPTGESVTTGSPSEPVSAVENPAPAAPAPQPQISLEGLPEAPADLAYVIVIEAGASDYSASPIAREEFPDLDATTRGTISIGRRLQDPLAELVKIDPQHIGVGLYQHDVKQKHLKESLEVVIGSSVNTVGVDLNTASVPLLRHVSGLNQLVAREVVSYREQKGKFTSRAQLQEVAGLGEKRFTQAAGFLKISDAADPLDATWIHPESYGVARQVLADLGFAPADLRDKAKLDEIRGKLATLNVSEVAARLNAGEPTVRDIFDALARPGRDPREDLPPPIFKKGVLKLEDITAGMELKGTVLNVVPFGAFVDIGLKESGLVHISQMANRYIKSPYDVVAVGDVITVWVMEVKPGEKKISLSMIPPGQERRPGGPGGGGGRGQQQGGPPPRERGERGDRPERGPAPQQQPQPQGDRGFQGRGQGPGAGQGGGFQPRGDRPPGAGSSRRGARGRRGSAAPPVGRRARGPVRSSHSRRAALRSNRPRSRRRPSRSPRLSRSRCRTCPPTRRPGRPR
ncbi:transcriptional accessory protein : Tex-like protein OS=Prevotella sp. F0091 GN=HMPREF9148_01585 PE=4 SV=1: Tex_N: HHH_3: S1 [Gemmataceae bacterium]|nr:transcriptional accessory protein : Tex-like protein OS=Prevotella sp. F0091 GN=HMPREF9148_01585 PE=4 SV=1: Tex_N: HHH_3: S1 [Gemmataceae bacterium]VTT96886.1 transcriptional accessory protein : Tex-like protein OS=Prevotella sp. F0091 GN=HMPREF9148_01585 PE=4 SV=1: Tex_N: HHH_3: S1 [Gemmataceae bacterium]